VYLQNERDDHEATVKEEFVEEMTEEVYINIMTFFVLPVLYSFPTVFFDRSQFTQPLYSHYSRQPVNLCWRVLPVKK